MNEKQGDEFASFTWKMMTHITETNDSGHYSGGSIQPLEFMENHLGTPWLCGQVIKYMARYPNTLSEKDILKATHYLFRLWSVNHKNST